MRVEHGKGLLTYREYALLPDDGRRHELIEGELRECAAYGTSSSTVRRRLQHALMTQLEDTGLAYVFNAPFDVVLADTTVVQPDLAIIGAKHRERISKRGLEGPPDIAVEILSESSKGQDRFLKKAVYAKYGVPEYWLVEPDLGFITVFRLREGGYEQQPRLDRASTLTSAEFPELSVPLAPIFRPL